MPKLNVRVAPRSGAKQFYRCGMEFTDVVKQVDVDEATATRLLEEQMLEVEEVEALSADNTAGNTGDNDDDTGNTSGDDGNHADAPAAPETPSEPATKKVKGK